MGSTIRVMTLNVWNLSGAWPDRAREIRRWINDLKPHIIGLQEVVRGAEWDQLREIIGDSYYSEYVPASEFWPDRSFSFGNAIASAWPIVRHQRVNLPDAGDEETRAALIVGIPVRAPIHELVVCCTHLNWRLDAGYVRERQVLAIDAELRRFGRTGDFPRILLGDLNAIPESTELRYLRGLASIEGRSTHFYDAWEYCNPGDQGATWSFSNPNTRSKHEPDRRLDYVLCECPNEAGSGKILKCELICHQALTKTFASDHFGVFAVFAAP